MNTQKAVYRLVIIIAIVALGAAGYFFNQVRILKANPNAAAQEEVANLVARVSRLIILPTDEVPTVATVSDPEALKDQAFFAQAQKGDKVLIYTTAKKAVLYSPTLNRIVEVAPVNIGAQKSINPPTTSPTKP